LKDFENFVGAIQGSRGEAELKQQRQRQQMDCWIIGFLNDWENGGTPRFLSTKL